MSRLSDYVEIPASEPARQTGVGRALTQRTRPLVPTDLPLCSVIVSDRGMYVLCEFIGTLV